MPGCSAAGSGGTFGLGGVTGDMAAMMSSNDSASFPWPAAIAAGCISGEAECTWAGAGAGAGALNRGGPGAACSGTGRPCAATAAGAGGGAPGAVDAATLPAGTCAAAGADSACS